MSDRAPRYYYLRCERMGSVTVAVASREAFAESSHPDDWTPFLLDAVTNRELRADLSLLAEASPGPVVLDLREITHMLGDAVARLLLFARMMAGAGKTLVVCAAAPILELLEITGLAGQVQCCSELDDAIGRLDSA